MSVMSDAAERYARVRDIFEGARGLEGAERVAFLEEQCSPDEGLRAEVEHSLACLEEGASGAFSERGVDLVRGAIGGLVADAEVPAGTDAGWLPEEVGGYQIKRRIGEGGMGVVYEALQQSPRRRVAIKLLHSHQSTDERLRRFRQEAELLGRLQHPGIAQIYEAGTFDLGRGEQPFFAMELVDGVTIRLYADREQLDRRARLALLAQVADGVQHAHERGVIHRDLKPDNVLVDGRGRPVVLDFGVAWAKEPSDVISTMMTEEGVLLGTLAYMAPEQFTGDSDAITPSVDVYALGIMAFELLSDRLPHDVAGLPLPTAIKVLSNEPCRRLGSVVPALRGDIETIVATALAREPDRRYPTAQAFAADIRRYLDDLPIAARPTSRIYRARMYARRHPSFVGGIMVLAIATIVSALFGANAARQRNAARVTSGHLRSVVEELARPFPVATRFVETTEAGARTILQGEQLTRESLVTLEVRSLIDLNLYVFNQDDSGAVSQIFPIEGLSPQNPLTADDTYSLPGQLAGTQVSWTIDSVGGTERFLILGLPTDVVFDRIDWDLEQLVAAAPSALPDSSDSRGLGTDPESGSAAALPLGTQSLEAFELLRARMERFGRGWVRVVQFSSGPREDS